MTCGFAIKTSQALDFFQGLFSINVQIRSSISKQIDDLKQYWKEQICKNQPWKIGMFQSSCLFGYSIYVIWAGLVNSKIAHGFAYQDFKYGYRSCK